MKCRLRPAVLSLLAFVISLTPAAAADFSYAKVKATGGKDAFYGAVTLVSPFGEKPDSMIPMLLLDDAGEYQNPWVRARHVAEVLPKATELLLYKGELLKIRPDPEGNPALVVGPLQEAAGADLRIVSVLPGDVERFQQEEKARGSSRVITAALVAEYWQTLLIEYITLFIRYPLTREEDILEKLRLVHTKDGFIFKRLLIEVGVLLKYDNIPDNKIDSQVMRAKLGEVIRSMSQDQWSKLSGLAFHIPAEFETSRLLHDGSQATPIEDSNEGFAQALQ